MRRESRKRSRAKRGKEEGEEKRRGKKERWETGNGVRYNANTWWPKKIQNEAFKNCKPLPTENKPVPGVYQKDYKMAADRASLRSFQATRLGTRPALGESTTRKTDSQPNLRIQHDICHQV